MNKKRKTINFITKTAIFGALAGILYCLKFHLPFLFPQFLEIQFSNLPAIIAGFAMGPLAGAVVIVIKTIIKILVIGSGTGYVGELADLIIGLMVVFSTSLIYRRLKSRKGALISLGVGIVVWVGAAIIANRYFLIDFYAKFYTNAEKGIDGMSMIIGACQVVIPSINAENFMSKYIMFAVIPFNLLLATAVSLVTFVVYKRISILFKEDFFAKKSESRTADLENSEVANEENKEAVEYDFFGDA